MKRALELDPKLADAAAEIGWLFEFRAEEGESFKEAISEAGAWGRRALEIDPRCGMGWAIMDMAEFMAPRPDGHKILEYGLKAVLFAPRNPFSYAVMGNTPIPTALILEGMIQSYRLDTLYLYAGANVGTYLFWLGRSTEGLYYLNEVLSIEPEFAYGLIINSFILADLGRTAEAAEVLKKVQGRIPDNSIMGSWVLCAKYILVLQQKDSRSAEALLKQILKRVNASNTISYEIDSITQFLLPFLARYGEIETALQFLKRDLEAGYTPIYDILALDPRLEPLRRDERFQPILEKSRRDTVEWMRVLAKVKSRGELPLYLEAPFANLLEKLNIKL